MPVIYHEESRNFHLFNEKISYIFTILKNGQLGQLYFGKRLRDRESFNHLLEFVTDQCLYVHLKMTVLFRWNISVKSIRLMAAEI